jgi:hypothetical protein
MAEPAGELHRDPHHDAAAVGGLVEPDRAGVVDLGARQRAPGEATPLLLVDDLGVPLGLKPSALLPVQWERPSPRSTTCSTFFIIRGRFSSRRQKA